MLYSDPYYYYNITRLKQPVLHRLIDLLVSDYSLKEHGKILGAEKVIIFLTYYTYNITYRIL